MSSLNFELLPVGKSQLGVATLNAEKSLNSLSLQMIEELHSQLRAWETDPKIIGVLIKGNGRAFCAGGDIRALYDSMKERSTYVESFFEKEYALDCSLYAYSKPLIVWAHGITMGGGMGIMQGARYRVVTDSTRMAMPEITIGLFPDVGASFFLKKVPNNWGLFLALSGVRIRGSEALRLNLADAWLKDDHLGQLLTAVTDFSETNFASDVDAWLKHKSQTPHGGDIFMHESFINDLLNQKDVRSLITWARGYKVRDEWEGQLIKNILAACPTSLGLIYALWEKSQGWNVAQSFYHEWYVAAQCGSRKDFQEGVRALLIDKDNQPAWQPGFDELQGEHIEAHFKSPRADQKNPLEHLINERSK